MYCLAQLVKFSWDGVINPTDKILIFFLIRVKLKKENI